VRLHTLFPVCYRLSHRALSAAFKVSPTTLRFLMSKIVPNPSLSVTSFQWTVCWLALLKWQFAYCNPTFLTKGNLHNRRVGLCLSPPNILGTTGKIFIKLGTNIMALMVTLPFYKSVILHSIPPRTAAGRPARFESRPGNRISWHYFDFSQSLQTNSPNCCNIGYGRFQPVIYYLYVIRQAAVSNPSSWWHS
jgi:hypothetical protein